MSFPYLDREGWYIFKIYFTHSTVLMYKLLFSLFSCKKKFFYKNQCLHSENDYTVLRELETELCL